MDAIENNFITQLKNQNSNLSHTDLKIGIVEMLLAFIEERMQLDELFTINESIRKLYSKQLDESNKIYDTINKIHDLHITLHDLKISQQIQEEIVNMMDDLLLNLVN